MDKQQMKLDPEKLSYAFFGKSLKELAQEIYKEFNSEKKSEVHTA